MKIKGYQKFIFSVVGIILLAYAGMRVWTWSNLRSFELKGIRPGKVSLVAVTPGAGYRVIVANRVAQLGQVEESKDGRGGFGGVDTTQATNLKRIPIKELLGTLDGNVGDAGKLIERMNELLPPDEPISPYVWKAEDVQKALDGDAALRKKLELDLQTTLDGGPVEQFSASRVVNGILIDSPVPMKVSVAGKPTTILARVRQKYQTRLAGRVEAEIGKKFTPSAEDMLSIYMGQARLDAQGAKENVRQSLEARLKNASSEDLSSRPARIAASAMVLVNEAHFTGASAREYKANDGTLLTDLSISLTEEGRKRLWKYSADRPGFQLMLIVDGVAIAAPRIATELAERNVTIVQMPDRELATDAVKRIQELAKS